MAKQIVVKCQKCGKKLKTDEKYLGQKGRCPHCNAVIRLSEASPGGGGEAKEQVVQVEQVETRENALLDVRRQDDVAIINFTTSRVLDQSNVQQLGEELEELVDKHGFKKIAMNFEHVNYMSSAVMGKLVSLYKRVEKEGGGMRLSNIGPNIYEIFQIMKFDELFDICDTEEDAIAELQEV